jgi:hypothetical protein
LELVAATECGPSFERGENVAAKIAAALNATASFPDPERDVAELVEALRGAVHAMCASCDPRARSAIKAADAILARIAPVGKGVGK